MILATDTNDAKFFYAKTSYAPTIGFRGIKLVNYSNDILAMVGLDFWTPNSVQMHVYVSSPKALTRKFIRECFTHVFVTCKRGLVVGVTPSNNVPALELNRRIGFEETHRFVDGWTTGVDMVVQELRAENCRWIRRH